MTERAKFEEIDVERINVREPDGTLRFTLTNKERMPEGLIRGQELPGRQIKSASFLYYNDDGTEMGGFAFGGGHELGGHGAFLSFDGFEKDQCMWLTFEEHKGKYAGGLVFMDRADEPLVDVVSERQRIDEMDAGA